MKKTQMSNKSRNWDFMEFNIGNPFWLFHKLPCAFFRWGNWSSGKLNNLSEDSECIDTTARIKPTYCGTDIYTLLYIKQIANKNPLYSTGNSTQYSVMTYMGIECFKEWIYMCMLLLLLLSRFSRVQLCATP